MTRRASEQVGGCAGGRVPLTHHWWMSEAGVLGMRVGEQTIPGRAAAMEWGGAASQLRVLVVECKA
eukprot:285246-Chlamydomonas_euryale.AAC.2